MKHGLATVLESVVSALQRHPRRVTAVVAAFLLCGGGGAFAVASLAPDVSDMPVREVAYTIDTLPLQSQIDSLDVHRFPMIFRGGGDCSVVDWTFLGGSIANWSFVCFVIIGLVMLALIARRAARGH